MDDSIKKEIYASFEEFVKRAHEGQYRRGGEPYFKHLSNVASKFDVIQEFETKMVAIGHDLLEDASITAFDLRGFKPLKESNLYLNPLICEAIEILTKDKYDDYMEYIERIKSDRWARKVKIADIIDNLNDLPTDKQMKKYAKALNYLINGV